MKKSEDTHHFLSLEI